MFGLTRWSPFDEMFNFQREVDRLFDQFWRDLPARTTAPGYGWSQSIQVNAGDEGWKINVPLPGVDPQHVNLEVAGNTLAIRIAEPGDSNRRNAQWEQTLTVPQFLDLDKISASHRHGMLELTLPLKDSVKPRRIQIETTGGEQKQLTAAA
jgi:HSP20 family protein